MVKHAWLLWLLGCGVEAVELAPRGDVLVIGDVPRDAIERFAAIDGMPDPKLLRYPEEGAALPANIAPLRFAWDGKPMSTYELLLESGERSLRVYTRDTSVTVPVERWTALLAEGELRVQLRSQEMMGKGMLRRAERTFAVKPALQGELFFATATEASRARISDPSSQPAELERARGAAGIAQLGPSQLQVDGRTLQVPAGGRIAHPSWSADGDAIVFTYWPASVPPTNAEGSVLAQLALDGSFRELSIQGATNARRPRSDGTRLVFEGGKLDDPELYVVAAAGGMAQRLMCEGKARAPAWLAGGWLGFISTREPPHAQLWLASLDDVRCTAPVWFPAQDAQRDYETMSFE